MNYGAFPAYWAQDLVATMFMFDMSELATRA